MEKKKQNITRLIASVVLGIKLSAEEQKILDDWLKNNTRNQRVFEDPRIRTKRLSASYGHSGITTDRRKSKTFKTLLDKVDKWRGCSARGNNIHINVVSR